MLHMGTIKDEHISSGVLFNFPNYRDNTVSRKLNHRIFSMGSTRNSNIIEHLNMRVNNFGKEPASLFRRLDKTASHCHTRQN